MTHALEEYIARRNQKRLLDLMGKLGWDESFDYIDALLAQMCIRHDLMMLTTDRDFTLAAQHCPLKVWNNDGFRSGSSAR